MVDSWPQLVMLRFNCGICQPDRSNSAIQANPGSLGLHSVPTDNSLPLPAYLEPYVSGIYVSIKMKRSIRREASLSLFLPYRLVWMANCSLLESTHIRRPGGT